MSKEYAYFSHRSCEYFPCHPGADPENFNCLFCYCPSICWGTGAAARSLTWQAASRIAAPACIPTSGNTTTPSSPGMGKSLPPCPARTGRGSCNRTVPPLAAHAPKKRRGILPAALQLMQFCLCGTAEPFTSAPDRLRWTGRRRKRPWQSGRRAGTGPPGSTRPAPAECWRRRCCRTSGC